MSSGGAGGEGAKSTKKRKKRAKKKKKAASGIGKEDPELKKAREWLESLSTKDLLNKDLFDEEATKTMRSDFASNAPFPALRIKNFMDEQYCGRLAEELEQLNFRKKKNDLYEFVQSDDLKEVSLPLVQKFKEVLYSPEFRGALSQITGIECAGLENEVSISTAVYQDTHRLLCHDDELSGRRIAYIMYLVPKDWSKEDGGALDLFNLDEKGEPNLVEASLVPEWNSFAFFEVSAKSYHQVAEVLTDKNRLSISGWFHGKPFDRPPKEMDPLPPFRPICTEEKSEEWMSRQYRKKGVAKKINKRFMNESSIELAEFMRKDRFSEVLKAFQALPEAKWEHVGPANKRNYDVCTALEGDVKALAGYLSGAGFAALLNKMTGLEVTSVHTEVRRLTSSSYTLAHDFNPENKETGLDVVFTAIAGDGKWSSTWGGTTHYLVENEDEELLSVDPGQNTMSIVFRAGGGVLQFLEYINHHAAAPVYQVACTFRVPDDSSSDEDDEGEDSDEEMEQKD